MKLSQLIRKLSKQLFDFEKEFKKNQKIDHDLSWNKDDPSYNDAFGLVRLPIDYILEGSVKLHSHIDLKKFIDDENFCLNFEIPRTDDELAKRELIKLFKNPERMIEEYDLLKESFSNWDKYIDQPESTPDIDDDVTNLKSNHLKPNDFKRVFTKIDARFSGDRLEIFYEFHFE